MGFETCNSTSVARGAWPARRPARRRVPTTYSAQFIPDAAWLFSGVGGGVGLLGAPAQSEHAAVPVRAPAQLQCADAKVAQALRLEEDGAQPAKRREDKIGEEGRAGREGMDLLLAAGLPGLRKMAPKATLRPGPWWAATCAASSPGSQSMSSSRNRIKPESAARNPALRAAEGPRFGCWRCTTCCMRKIFCHRMEPYCTQYPEAARHLPVTERASGRILCLPTGPTLDAQAISTICGFLRFVTGHNAEVRERWSGFRRKLSTPDEEVR